MRVPLVIEVEFEYEGGEFALSDIATIIECVKVDGRYPFNDATVWTLTGFVADVEEEAHPYTVMPSSGETIRAVCRVLQNARTTESGGTT